MMAFIIPVAATMSLIAKGNAIAGTIITAATGRDADISAKTGGNGGKAAARIGANGVATVAIAGRNCAKVA
jgi:hypothetical protein